MTLMKRWFNYVKERTMPIIVIGLFILGILTGLQGCYTRRAINEARAERDQYIERSRELMAGLQQSEDLVRESLGELGEIKQLHSELRDQITEIGKSTQGVGDSSVGIGIRSDENLRIIRELRSRVGERKEK